MTHAKSGKERDACSVKNRDTPPPGLAFGEPSGGRRRLRVWRVGIHRIRIRDLAARYARVVAEFFAPLEGVGNAGCPLHPRPRVHVVLVERTRVTTSTPESPGIPARNGFNSLCRALVSAKSARMCERAVLTNRPSLDLSPFVLEGREPDGERGTDPVSSSTRTVAWA